MRLFVLCLCFLLSLTQAAVVISEVAWMGSAASANHEWIELYNDGSAVDVTGWTVSDGMNLLVTLAGTIPAQSYAVLERTSDASANGAAFVIYSGALVNTGAILQLKRSDGGLEDQVAGGENWVSIGGDNVTKETAQYTTSGWVTGVGTPGSTNSGTPKDVPEEEKDDDEEDSDEDSPKQPVLKTNTGEAVRLLLPGMNLKLVVEAQTLGYVHQSIDFTVTPSGVGDTLIDSLGYEWNFGDGATAFAKEPTHTYQFPGTYVVTVYGGYKRQEQVARHEITILPVTLSLTSFGGNLQVHNDSPYEIDISKYSVDGGKRFLFPARSVMLPNQTITLTPAQVGAVENAVIRDSAGIAVMSKGKSVRQDTPTVPTEPSKQEVIAAPAPAANTAVPTVWHAPLLRPDADALRDVMRDYFAPQIAEAAQEMATSTKKKSSIPDSAWPYLGLIGVIILGLFGTAKKVLGNQN